MNPWRLTACVLVLCSCGGANAELVHRYSFLFDASDSVGGAHGVVVDPGAQSAFFYNGWLDVTANTGQNSNTIFEDAYVDLPNGIFTSALNSGVSGQITIEIWATPHENRTFATLFTAGTSNDGEDTSSSGSQSAYVQIAPMGFNNNLTFLTHSPSGNSYYVYDQAPMSTSWVSHVVATIEQLPSGYHTLELYLNGEPVMIAGFNSTGLQLQSMPDNNIWLGRSQWSDEVFDGTYDELRIYNTALDAQAVARNYQLGPDVLPVLIGDLNLDGFVGIADLNIVLGDWNAVVDPGVDPDVDPAADPSGDRFVGIADLNIVLGNWNAGTPPDADLTIPEPSCVSIICSGLLLLMRRQ